MYEFYYRNKQVVDRVAFFLIVFISIFLLFTVLFPFLSPFLFGLVIALMMNPLINVFTKRLKFKRWLASSLSLLIFIAFFLSIGVGLTTTLVRQVSSFVENAPANIELISARLEAANVWLQRLSETLPERFVVPETIIDGNVPTHPSDNGVLLPPVATATIEIPDIQTMLLNLVQAIFNMGILGQGLTVLQGVPNFFINTLIALVSAYFFMSDRDKIFNAIKKATPKWLRDQMTQTQSGLKRAMGGYFRAQFMLMGIIGLIGTIGLAILRNPYALLLGLLIAVLDFMPALGPAIILIPWAIMSFVMGNIPQGIGLLVIYGVMTIVRQILQPKILGDQMGAHPLATLMSFFIGWRIFGILGFIIGPSILMLIIAIRDSDKEIATPVTKKKTVNAEE